MKFSWGWQKQTDLEPGRKEINIHITEMHVCVFASVWRNMMDGLNLKLRLIWVSVNE